MRKCQVIIRKVTSVCAQRVARYLERQGLLVCDAGSSYLTAKGVDADPNSPMKQLLGSSITYRIAVGPQQGRWVPGASGNLPTKGDVRSALALAIIC